MDDEQKEWQKQFWINFGLREYFRFGCAFIIWIFILVALSIAFAFAGYSANSTSIIFSAILVITIFVFPFIARSWRPAYSLLRKILGNDNLPMEPMPRSRIKIPRQQRPWWSYLPGIWGWLMLLLLLYVILKR